MLALRFTRIGTLGQTGNARLAIWRERDADSFRIVARQRAYYLAGRDVRQRQSLGWLPERMQRALRTNSPLVAKVKTVITTNWRYPCGKWPMTRQGAYDSVSHLKQQN